MSKVNNKGEVMKAKYESSYDDYFPEESAQHTV